MSEGVDAPEPEERNKDLVLIVDFSLELRNQSMNNTRKETNGDSDKGVYNTMVYYEFSGQMGIDNLLRLSGQ